MRMLPTANCRIPNSVSIIVFVGIEVRFYYNYFFYQKHLIIMFQFFPNVDKSTISLAAHRRYLVNM